MTPVRRLVAVGGVTVDTIRTRQGDYGPHVGGNAVYAAAGAWLVGSEGIVCARIGSDFPKDLMTQLQRAGLETGGVVRTNGPSLKVTLDYRSEPRLQSYAADSGHNAELDPAADQLGQVDADSAVHLCGIPPERQRALYRAVAGRTRLVSLDTVIIPGEIEPGAEEMVQLAQEADAFLPSREEASYLWPGQAPREVLRQLFERGCRTMVLKLGAGGSIGISSSGIISMPAYPVDAVDTTGAGDAFCGAFAAVYGADRELEPAMAWATAAASCVIEDFGALGSLNQEGRSKVAQRAHMLLTEQTKRGGGVD